MSVERLGLVLALLPDGPGDGDSELPEPQAERLPGHAQGFGRLILVAVGELREAAHKLRGVVSAFSTGVAEAVAELEQMGVEGDCGGAGRQYPAVASAVQDLLTLVPDLTIERLREQVPAGPIA